MPDELDGLEPLGSVLSRDERWHCLGNRTLEQHHAYIAQFELSDAVPADVRQHFENARNTWLYAFFSYRLLQVALMQVHVAGEAAIKARAKLEGVDTDGKPLKALLDMAIDQRWLLDVHFEITVDRTERELQGRERLRQMGEERDLLVGPLHEQDYAKRLMWAFRNIRNELAHGGVILDPNLGWAFLAVRDLINQLFPAARA
jgi:hypothetical protein